MKKIYLLYYSQTGQLTDIVKILPVLLKPKRMSMMLRIIILS
jgi:hypothetical protein